MKRYLAETSPLDKLLKGVGYGLTVAYIVGSFGVAADYLVHKAESESMYGFMVNKLTAMERTLDDVHEYMIGAKAVDRSDKSPR